MQPLPDTKIYADLRSANIARQALWDPENKVDLVWRINELAGEAGEVCNFLKKVHRERVGLPGSRATTEQVMAELADVAICADLVLMTIDPAAFLTNDPKIRMLPNENLTILGAQLDAWVGSVCHTLFASDFKPRSKPFHPAILDQFMRALSAVHLANVTIARALGVVDMDIFIANKFNETSRNVGLPVLLDIGLARGGKV